MTSTSDARLGISALKEIAKKDLIDALNSVNGAKTLVLDASLAGPLGLITEVSLLKHHGVDKMFWLERGPLSSATPNVVYLCRPSIQNIKVVADHVKRHAKESARHNYTVFLVPRVSTLSTKILEEEGVLGEVTLRPYNLQFIPVAEDVISLEHETAFKEIWVDGDETIVYDSAQALLSLQNLFGSFPRIIGKGDHASRLANYMVANMPQGKNGSIAALLEADNHIDSLIVLDRKVDMITPLLTQLTYEGLIDELIGIKNSHVELPASLLAASNEPPTTAQTAQTQTTPGPSIRKEAKKKYLLSDSDALFMELRDLNFSFVPKRLNGVAHRIEEDYKTSLQAKTIPQLKDVVGKLGGLKSEHQSLRIQTGLSEMLVPMSNTDLFNKSLEIQQNLLASYNLSEQLTSLEELISQGADMQTVVRLLCLASLTSGGIKAKTLDNLKREILQTYGYQVLPMLVAFSSPDLSLLLPTPLPPSLQAVSNSKYPFTALRKSLRLFLDENPEELADVENDISFAYSVYAPVSVRLVQCIAHKAGVLSNPAEKERAPSTTDEQLTAKPQAHPIVGWKGFEDVVQSIPGKTFDISTRTPDSSATVTSQPAQREQKTTTVVFFLGGCTYAEIAALRWIGRQNRGRDFLIATTGIVTGKSLIEGIASSTNGARAKDAGL